MRQEKQQSLVIFWISAGMLGAALAANRLFSAGILDCQMLYSFVRRGWSDLAEKRLSAMMWVAGLRAAQTVLVVLVCRSRFCGAGVRLLLAGYGAAAGVSLVLMTWNRGLFGPVVFLVSAFPHGLCHMAAWGILIFGCLSGFELRRGRIWAAVLVLEILGVLSEIQVNPLFIGVI